jgi:sugar fermentation stimulation protein A
LPPCMIKIFHLDNIREGRFLDRPNRFVVRCAIGRRTCEAYLPNPGRLWELLQPGRTLYLIENPRETDLKLPWLCVAAVQAGRPVLLHTHWNNEVAARLIDGRRIPGLEDARIVRREVAFGRSRFDFLLQRAEMPALLEVKSCTLFGRRIAMFPDAVTLRGRRHLTELAASARMGTPAVVLFLVHCAHAEFFLPDYHTDIEFSRTFLALRQVLEFKAVAVQWRKNMTLSSRVRELAIPWDVLEREAGDRGSYILVLELLTDRCIPVGGLGNVFFRKGFYLYVGSARRSLAKRIERHLRRRKKFFWHVDYLRDQAERCMAIPIRASRPLEHEIARSLEAVAEWSIPGFGCSDCACETHLFGMHIHPVCSPRFISLLQHFRIDRLESML